MNASLVLHRAARNLTIVVYMKNENVNANE